MFDLDGTLIRSTIDFKKLKKKTIKVFTANGVALTHFNLEMKAFEIVKRGIAVLRARHSSDRECSSILNRVKEMWNRVELETIYKTQSLNGARKTLKKIKEKGMKIGVITRGCRVYAINALKIAKLLDLVDLVVARGDSIKPKPDPEALTIVMRALGLQKDEIIMIGDSTLDLQFAQNGRIPFIGVLTGLTSREELREWGCQTILDCISQLVILFRY
jgi:HAD superfamily hydrolase (TIGR01549 family)